MAFERIATLHAGDVGAIDIAVFPEITVATRAFLEPVIHDVPPIGDVSRMVRVDFGAKRYNATSGPRHEIGSGVRGSGNGRKVKR